MNVMDMAGIINISGPPGLTDSTPFRRFVRCAGTTAARRRAADRSDTYVQSTHLMRRLYGERRGAAPVVGFSVPAADRRFYTRTGQSKRPEGAERRMKMVGYEKDKTALLVAGAMVMADHAVDAIASL
jgi:hypothetical protein